MRLSNATGGTAIAAITLAVTLLAPGAGAQTNAEGPKPSEPRPAAATPAETVQTIFLTHISGVNDLNDIQTDLRNVLPRTRIYGVQSKNAITLRGTAEDLETAQKLVAILDQPKKIYRLTFTITSIDEGKRTGSQRFVLLAVMGERSTFKQGSRVPIVIGTKDGQNSQVQYNDVGLTIESTITGSPEGLNLRAKVEQSSLGEEKPAFGQDPVFHQTVLDESSELVPGKPLLLGSLDIPDSPRRQEIEVVADPVR